MCNILAVQSVEFPSKVPDWFSSALSSIPGSGIGVEKELKKHLCDNCVIKMRSLESKLFQLILKHLIAYHCAIHRVYPCLVISH